MKISMNQLPKRIIISRKGSDSSYGGSPSLIVGGELISIPIPEHPKEKICDKRWHLKYADLPQHRVIGDYVSYLPKLQKQGQECVHLDPDIRPELRPKDVKSSKFLFGQSGAAEGHLRNKEIGKDDLFLFFGWFRVHSQGPDKYVPSGPDQHVIWGWFEVEEKHLLDGQDAEYKPVNKFEHHPHVARMGKASPKKDSLYVATCKLSFASQRGGAGVFEYVPSLVLTRHCELTANRTEWCLPGFFAKTGLTYNSKSTDADKGCGKDRTRIHVNAANIGQEFVFPAGKDETLEDYSKEVRSQVADWLSEIFT